MTSYLACMKKVKGMNDPSCRELAKSYFRVEWKGASGYRSVQGVGRMKDWVYGADCSCAH